jgi:2-succinyl-6-hydroxy-2,4-cyclohexadiene-1-carboxylate synthase
MPVALITGQQDHKFVRINQSMNRDIPDCRLNIIQESGHRVHKEQPSEVIRLIRQFLNDHPAPDIDP